jgi:hypothetical protein
MPHLKHSSKPFKSFVVLLAVLVSSCGTIYKGDMCLSNAGAQSAACVNVKTGVERIVPWSETMNWLMVPQEDTAALLRACRLKPWQINLTLEALDQGYKRNAEIGR